MTSADSHGFFRPPRALPQKATGASLPVDVVNGFAMKIEPADRIRELPPYLFAHIDALKREQRAKGRDLIDLGIGDPDLPTHPHIVEALVEAARDGRNHRYPSYVGMDEMRQAAASFMERRFGVV